MKIFIKYPIMFLVWVRWVYFHIHWNYIPFWMTENEKHFQHKKTGAIYCNFKWVD